MATVKMLIETCYAMAEFYDQAVKLLQTNRVNSYTNSITI